MKRKQKFASAEAKRNFYELQESWKQLKAKYEPKQLSRQDDVYRPASIVPPRGESIYHPSRGDGGGVALKTPDKVYTGTKIIGIGTMHKSNAVPIFNDEEAKAISSMRR